jgi:hypothetical protein
MTNKTQKEPRNYSVTKGNFNPNQFLLRFEQDMRSAYNQLIEQGLIVNTPAKYTRNLQDDRH